MTEQGSVKWYSIAKGYGFLSREGASEGSGDIFVHYSEIFGGEVLQDGERVSFEVFEGPKGLQARKVTRLEEHA